MNYKVYFDKHSAQYNHEQKNSDDIEYINKNTLLEWANTELHRYDNGEDYGSQWNLGFRCAVKALIDKLNTL